MSEKAKVFMYTAILIALYVAWAIYSGSEQESCESSGGVYTRQNIGWSFECVIDTIKE